MYAGEQLRTAVKLALGAARHYFGGMLLAQTLMPCHFVVKNHGPESLRLVAQNGDLMDLPSGKVRATYAHRTVTVENRSEKWVLIEFDFVPVHVMR